MKIPFQTLQKATVAVVKNDHPDFEEFAHVEQGHILAHYLMLVGSFIDDLPDDTTSENFRENKPELRNKLLQISLNQIEEFKENVEKENPGIILPDTPPIDEMISTIDFFLGKMQIAVDSIDSTEGITSLIENFSSIDFDQELKNLLKDDEE